MFRISILDKIWNACNKDYKKAASVSGKKIFNYPLFYKQLIGEFRVHFDKLKPMVEALFKENVEIELKKLNALSLTLKDDLRNAEVGYNQVVEQIDGISSSLFVNVMNGRVYPLYEDLVYISALTSRPLERYTDIIGYVEDKTDTILYMPAGYKNCVKDKEVVKETKEVVEKKDINVANKVTICRTVRELKDREIYNRNKLKEEIKFNVVVPLKQVDPVEHLTNAGIVKISVADSAYHRGFKDAEALFIKRKDDIIKMLSKGTNTKSILMMKDLQKQLIDQDAEMRELRKSALGWKDKYNALTGENARLKMEIDKLKSDNEILTSMNIQFKKIISPSEESVYTSKHKSNNKSNSNTTVGKTLPPDVAAKLLKIPTQREIPLIVDKWDKLVEEGASSDNISAKHDVNDGCAV